ncbi:MAG: insulinase family protein [Gemmatimonadetes bacterium]|nr:insulinase family protein [Gemmatimonadota bacterium]
MTLLLAPSVVDSQPTLSRIRDTPGFRVSFVDTTLANGLRVVLVPQRFAPIVSVSLMLRVGSRDDTPGRTGIAHLLEHLAGDPAFASQRRFGGWASGGFLPGFTGFSDTGYSARTPSANLDAVLFDFADLLQREHIGEMGLERGVRGVLAEHAQGVYNQAYGLSGLCAWEAYWRGITRCRSPEDIERDVRAATVDELRTLFRERYRPDNAVLVLAGDVDAPRALRSIARFVGARPAQPIPARRAAAPAQVRPQIRLAVTDRLATAPRVDVAFRGTPSGARDFAAVAVLQDLLVGSGSALLSRLLIDERQVAARVESWGEGFPGSTEPAPIGIGIVGRAQGQPDSLEQALTSAFSTIVNERLTARLVEQAKARLARSFVEETRARGPDALAYLLSELAVDGQTARINGWVDELDAVTLADVLAAARRYLLVPAQVVMHTLPDSAARAPGTSATIVTATTTTSPQATTTATTSSPAPPRATVVMPAVVSPSFSVPSPARVTLANGVQVLHVVDPRTPFFDVRLVIRHDGPAAALRTSPLAAVVRDVVPYGTATQSRAQLQATLDSLGLTLVVGQGATDEDGRTTTFRITGLASEFEAAMGVLGALVRAPALRADDIRAVMQQHNRTAATVPGDPRAFTQMRAWSLLSGTRSAGASSDLAARAPSADATLAAQVHALHRATYRPEITSLVVAGPVALADVRRWAERALGTWGGPSVATSRPRSTAMGCDARASVDTMRTAPPVDSERRAGSAQTTVTLATIIPTRTGADHALLAVAAAVLRARIGDRALTERWVSYGHRVQVAQSSCARAVSVQVSVPAAQAAQAVRAMQEELDALVTRPLASVETDVARNAVVMLRLSESVTAARVVDHVVVQEVNGAPTYWRDYAATLHRLTSGQFAQFAAMHLRQGPRAWAVLGDSAGVQAALDAVRR